jgi:hypothetical protein
MVDIRKDLRLGHLIECAKLIGVTNHYSTPRFSMYPLIIDSFQPIDLPVFESLIPDGKLPSLIHR